MIVFNNYFKIVKKHLGVIFLYSGIFIFLAIFASRTTEADNIFSPVKANVAIINRDESTTLTDGFIDYVSQKSIIKPLKDDELLLKDALFYRDVDYVLIIPKNFTSDFLNLKNPKIETMNIPNSYGMIYTEILLDRFLNTAKTYVQSGMNEHQIINNIKNDLKTESKVTFLGDSEKTTTSTINNYYNYYNYAFLAICVYIISTLYQTFNEINVKRRNLASSFSYKQMNKSLFLGNLCLTLLIWGFYVFISALLYPKIIFTSYGLLLIINSLIFTISSLSFAILISNLVKSKDAISGVANVISLGSSFICGAFVPQQLLSDFVLSIAKFFPSYWFIKNNNLITVLGELSFTLLKPIYINMLIILIFGIIFKVINNLIIRLRLKNNNLYI